MAIVDSFTKGLERIPGGNAILTSVDALADWSRGQSLWEMPMGTACCAMELIACSFSKFATSTASARSRVPIRATTT